ncbi:hypothetical protein GCM10007918_29680 [Piscinibacter gummiphilus]|nr:hypothetical protein GCM10007918_29680 [Piscinibacter gummiphilus]
MAEDAAAAIAPDRAPIPTREDTLVNNDLQRSARIRPTPRTATALAALALLAACGGGGSGGAGTATETDASASDAAEVAEATAAGGPVCFFEHVNYQGASYCSGADSAWVGSAWNDRISSVKVQAGYKVQLFQHINYGGGSTTLSADNANLVALGFNDAASSFKVTAPVTPPTTGPSPVASIQIAQSLLFNSNDSALVLVANKAALIKVNITGSNPKASKPTGVLRVSNVNGGATRDIVLTLPTGDLPATTPAVPSFTDSYTATVPAEFVKAGLRLTVNVGDTTPTTLTPRVGGGVPMTLVPISVRIGGTSGQVPANQGPHIQALFPVASVTVRNHATYTSGRVTTLPTTDSGWSDAFGKILGELADLHTLEGAQDHDHYFGFIPKRTWGLAGLAYLRGSAGVGFDMPSAPTSVRDVVAHELGHNFSLPHAACGGAGSPDPNYPYPDANLGKPGRYVWPYLSDTNTFYDPRPTDRHDIMSYCGGQVFSDYNYRQMQTYLTPTDRQVLAAGSDRDTTAAVQELLLISGEIRADGTGELNPVKSLSGKPRVPAAGDYTLRIVADTGTVEYPFAPRTLDHDASTEHFGFTVPNPGAVQSVTVVRDGKVLLNTQARAQRLQAGDAVATQVQEAAGTLRLTWDATRHAFLTVTWVGTGGERRTLAQDLRGGSATLPTADLPAGGSFELIRSDGLNAVRSVHGR